MKRLLVISDIHGNISALNTVLKWVLDCTHTDGAIDAAVFLGDGIYELSMAKTSMSLSFEWVIVRGNTDFANYPEAAVFQFGGHCFFLCHGHRYKLYNGYHMLIAAAQKMGANAALFGHTHVPLFENVNGFLLVNPGSIGRARSKAGATFALIECLPEKPLKIDFWGIDADGRLQEIRPCNS
jgi:putative phosphoesterase